MNDKRLEKRVCFIESCVDDITRLMNKGGSNAYYRRMVVRRVVEALTSSEVGYLTQAQIDTKIDIHTMVKDIRGLRTKLAPEKVILKDIAELRKKVLTPPSYKRSSPAEIK